MNDPHKTASTMMVVALVLALAALLAGPASARPIIDEIESAPTTQAAVHPNDLGGPQGVGAVASRPLVVPYLSQGMGVDANDFGGTGVAAAEIAATPTSDDGFAWDSLEVGTAAALGALLLAAMSLFALRTPARAGARSTSGRGQRTEAASGPPSLARTRRCAFPSVRRDRDRRRVAAANDTALLPP